MIFIDASSVSIVLEGETTNRSRPWARLIDDLLPGLDMHPAVPIPVGVPPLLTLLLEGDACAFLPGGTVLAEGPVGKRGHIAHILAGGGGPELPSSEGRALGIAYHGNHGVFLLFLDS